MSNSYGMVEAGEPMMAYFTDAAVFDRWIAETKKNFGISGIVGNNVIIDNRVVKFIIDKDVEKRHMSIRAICDALTNAYKKDVYAWDGRLNVSQAGIYECKVVMNKIEGINLRALACIATGDDMVEDLAFRDAPSIYNDKYNYRIILQSSKSETLNESQLRHLRFIRVYRLVEQLSERSVYSLRMHEIYDGSLDTYKFYCSPSEKLLRSTALAVDEPASYHGARYLIVDGEINKKCMIVLTTPHRYDFNCVGVDAGFVYSEWTPVEIKRKLEGRFKFMESMTGNGLIVNCDFKVDEGSICSRLPVGVSIAHGPEKLNDMDYGVVLKSWHGYVRCIFTTEDEAVINEEVSKAKAIYYKKS
jgi:hypothetical protein